MKKNICIEWLRGILMTWIVLYHFTKRYNEFDFGHIVKYPYTFDNGGYIGVTMFFLISGYFLGKSFEKEVGGAIHPLRFLIKKYLRLWPAYAFSCIIVFLFLHLLPLPTVDISFRELLVNVILIIHPKLGFVDTAHWYLQTLLEVYVVFAVSLFISKAKYRDSILCCILIVLILLKFLLDLDESASVFVNAYVSIMSGYIFAKGKKQKLWLAMAVSIWFFMLFSTGIKLIIWLILFALACFNPIHVVNFRSSILKLSACSMTYVGECSFYWYLVHQRIGYSIQYHFVPDGVDNFLWIILPVAITFSIAVILMSIVNRIPSLYLLLVSQIDKYYSKNI